VHWATGCAGSGRVCARALNFCEASGCAGASLRVRRLGSGESGAEGSIVSGTRVVVVVMRRSWRLRAIMCSRQCCDSLRCRGFDAG